MPLAGLSQAWAGLSALAGMVLGAAYLLELYRRASFGRVVQPAIARFG